MVECTQLYKQQACSHPSCKTLTGLGLEQADHFKEQQEGLGEPLPARNDVDGP